MKLLIWMKAELRYRWTKQLAVRNTELFKMKREGLEKSAWYQWRDFQCAIVEFKLSLVEDR